MSSESASSVRSRSRLATLAGLAGTCGLLGAMGFASARDPAVFLQPVSLAVIAAGTFFGLCLSFRPGQIVRAVNAAFRRSGDAAAEHARVLDAARAYVMAYGLLASLAGSVVAFTETNDRETLARSLALCATPLLYSIVLGEVALRALRSRLPGPGTGADSTDAPR